MTRSELFAKVSALVAEKTINNETKMKTYTLRDGFSADHAVNLVMVLRHKGYTASLESDNGVAVLVTDAERCAVSLLYGNSSWYTIARQ